MIWISNSLFSLWNQEVNNVRLSYMQLLLSLLFFRNIHFKFQYAKPKYYYHFTVMSMCFECEIYLHNINTGHLVLIVNSVLTPSGLGWGLPHKPHWFDTSLCLCAATLLHAFTADNDIWTSFGALFISEPHLHFRAIVRSHLHVWWCIFRKLRLPSTPAGSQLGLSVTSSSSPPPAQLLWHPHFQRQASLSVHPHPVGSIISI